MARYALRRVPSALIVLVAASALIFAMLRLVPGDPAASLAGPDAAPEAIRAIRDHLGLDAPPLQAYLDWLGSVTTFRLGRSYAIGGDVSTLVLDGLANTLVLAGAAVGLSVLIAVVVSTASVVADRRWLNAVVAGANTVAIAIPMFVTGVLLVLLFAVVWNVLPAGGVPRDGLLANPGESARHLLLPAVCLALPMSAALVRFLSESMRDQFDQPYVTTARALGITRRRIVLTQMLPNALPPAVTVLGLQIGTLLGGAVIVEEIFAWPGLGHLTMQAISTRDYPVVQVLMLLTVAVFVIVQLVGDLVNARLDPRIRLDGAT